MGFSCNQLDEWCCLTLVPSDVCAHFEKKKQEVSSRWISHCKTRMNTVGSRVEWSSVFVLVKQVHFLLHMVLKQIINSQAVNMRARSIQLFFFIHVYILTLAYRKYFIESVSKSQHMDIIRKLPTYQKETENPNQ